MAAGSLGCPVNLNAFTTVKLVSRLLKVPS